MGIIYMGIQYRKISLYAAVLIAFFMCSCGVKKPVADSNASFKTKDGVLIKSEFVPATDDKITFIMLHGLGSNRNEWKSFSVKLSDLGFGCFLIDLRGHGQSVKDKNGNNVDYRYFIPPGFASQWNLLPEDIARAVEYLVKKGVKRNKIGFMGASLGANLAILYASEHKSVPAVVLLSPGMDYVGISIEKAVENYGNRPILIAASPGDAYAYQSSLAITDTLKKTGASATFLPGSGSAHGVQMFNGEFETNILDWLKGLKE
jgi:pimeloyl-ACP methyl ester carboxylesterase